MDKWLQSNMFAKIFAVMLAVLLWLVVNADDGTVQPSVTEHEYKVPITYLYDDTQFAIMVETENVDILLRGHPLDIRRVFPGSLKVVADAMELEQGTHTLQLQLEGIPTGVQASIHPAEVTIALDRKTTVEMPVQIVLQGVVAPGFTVGQPIISPSRIFVTGTEENLERIQSITAQIVIQDARAAIEQTVRVRAFDAQGNEVQVDINPAVVDVTVPVSSPFKELPLNLHYEGYPAQGFSVSRVLPSLEAVTIFGPQEEIDRYEYFPVPIISIEGLSQTSTVDKQLPVLEGVTQIQPESISFTVEVVASETRRLENIPILMNGLGDNINVKMELQNLDVSFEAAPERLKNLKKEDIQVFIDVSNKTLGEHVIPIQIVTPRFVKPFDLQTNEVKVTIERR